MATTLRSIPQFASATLLFATTAFAQVMSAPGTYQGPQSFHPHRQVGFQHDDPGDTTQPAAQPAAAPAPATTPATPASAQPAPAALVRPGLPPSLLDQPAQPAKVDLNGGKLTISADNSSLTAILQQVSSSAGMTVEGLNKDERIFGTYGPGSPREILSALLDGTGYNILMFGDTTSGAPRELTLSARGASSAQPGPARAVQQSQDDEDDSVPPPIAEESTPPPNATPAPPTPGPSNGVRSPQQMLQELQQMRTQQQSQETEQPPQQR
jgi:hypothetical protein